MGKVSYFKPKFKHTGMPFDKSTLRPIMYIGADVTHPSPDQIGRKPSIAAIVSSVDPEGAIYKCKVS